MANPHTKSLMEFQYKAATLPNDLFNTNYSSCQECSILFICLTHKSDKE